jgi:hypothetical protein
MLRIAIGVVAGFTLSLASVGGAASNSLRFNGVYCEQGGKVKSITCIPLDGNGFSVSMSAKYFYMAHNGKTQIFQLNK